MASWATPRVSLFPRCPPHPQGSTCSLVEHVACSPGAVPPLTLLLSISLIWNMSQPEPSAGACPSLSGHSQGSAVLGWEPDAPLKLLPGSGPAAASPLCPEAVAPSRAAHQSPSCLSSPAQRGSGREEGQAGPGPPRGWDSGAFPLRALPLSPQSSAPAGNRYLSGWGGAGTGTLQGPKQGPQAQTALMARNMDVTLMARNEGSLEG